MGWFVGHSTNGTLAIWHEGDTPNFLAEMILLLDHHLGVAVLINSQNSLVAHDIAPSVASLMLGSELELPAAPWWASWETVDNIATVVAVLALVLMLVLAVYVWWRWRQFRDYRRKSLGSPFISRILTVRQIVLPITPLIILGTLALVAFIVVRVLFGFNLYQAMIQFGMFAPLGVWLSGMVTLAVICLWAIALAGLALLRIKSESEAWHSS